MYEVMLSDVDYVTCATYLISVNFITYIATFNCLLIIYFLCYKYVIQIVNLYDLTTEEDM